MDTFQIELKLIQHAIQSRNESIKNASDALERLGPKRAALRQQLHAQKEQDRALENEWIEEGSGFSIGFLDRGRDDIEADRALLQTEIEKTQAELDQVALKLQDAQSIVSSDGDRINNYRDSLNQIQIMRSQERE